jgi:hypothetical protein
MSFFFFLILFPLLSYCLLFYHKDRSAFEGCAILSLFFFPPQSRGLRWLAPLADAFCFALLHRVFPFGACASIHVQTHTERGTWVPMSMCAVVLLCALRVECLVFCFSLMSVLVFITH